MLKQFALDETRVSKVWVRLLATDDGSMMRWLIGVETSAQGDERQYIFDTLKRFITPILGNVESIVASSDEDYVKQAIKDVKPFYERT